MALLLVLNVHGKINSNSAVRKAMTELKTERKFTASVVPDDVNTMGMLRLCKDYLAWAPADKETLAALLKSRGMVSESKRLDEKALGELGYKKYEEMAGKLIDGGIRLSEVRGIRPFFRLSPPKGGFKKSGRRQASNGGTLGKNPELAEIVRRMV